MMNSGETENLAALSEAALASLILPNLINPALDKVNILNSVFLFWIKTKILFYLKLEKEDSVSLTKSNIKSVFAKTDNLLPNLAFDFINELFKINWK